MADIKAIPCPSCGKPIPADAPACRFCSASTVHRLPLWILTAGIVVLLVLSAIHFFEAMTYQPQLTKISNITSALNFKRVRVLGRISNLSIMRGAYSNYSVRIELKADDATPGTPFELSSIPVRLEGEGADDFIRLDKPIRRGDLVEVAASVNAGAGYRQLSVSSPSFIKVKERAPEQTLEDQSIMKTTVSALMNQPEPFRGKIIQIANAVVIKVSDNFPSFVIVDPGQTNASLTVFGDESHQTRVGQHVSVRGEFAYYDKKGYWEIKIPRGDTSAVADVPGQASE